MRAVPRCCGVFGSPRGAHPVEHGLRTFGAAAPVLGAGLALAEPSGGGELATGGVLLFGLRRGVGTPVCCGSFGQLRDDFASNQVLVLPE